MKKHLSALVLAIAMILCCINLVSAENNATFTDKNGVVYQFSDDSSYLILKSGLNTAGTVTVPSTIEINKTSYTVKEVASKAFYGSSATAINLPTTLDYIGDMAFAYCPQLTRVSFGRAKVTLGNRIFAGSANLTGVTNYSSFEKIGYGVFEETEWLQTKSVSTVNDALYLGKVLVTYFGDASSFSISSSCTCIAPDAFSGNTTLTSIDLTNIKSIGSSAFEDCTELASVTFGNSLVEVGAYAFDGCSSLGGEIALPDTCKKLGAFAFSKTAIETADLSKTNIASIGNGAFKNCDSLCQVILSESTKHIGNYAFQGDSMLSDINAQNVLSVGYDAFKGCSFLSDVENFENVESVLSGAFDGTIIYEDANGSALVIGKTLYKTEETSVNLAVADGVKSISPYAFYATEEADLLALPTSLESIDENAFISLSDGTIFVFSQNDKVYTDLKALPTGTVYVPEGKTIENDNISLGYIKGISVTKAPDKSEYDSTEQFDPAGIEIELLTEIDGVERSYNISEIGYEPSYTYNFSISPVIKVNYCGFETSFDVSVEISCVPGDANRDGNVNSDDILLIRKYIAGLVAEKDIDLAAADIAGANGVNSDDLLLLRKAVAGLVSLK